MTCGVCIPPRGRKPALKPRVFWQVTNCTSGDAHAGKIGTGLAPGAERASAGKGGVGGALKAKGGGAAPVLNVQTCGRGNLESVGDRLQERAAV